MMHLKTIFGLALIILVLSGCKQKPKQNDKELREEQFTPTNEQKGEEVNDKELQLFTTIQQQVNTINQQSYQEKVKIVEDLGLSVERFTEIEQAQQNPGEENDITQEELQKYQEAIQFLEQIQSQDQQRMIELIENEGLSIERYQEIEQAIQSDPDLQAKFQMMLQENEN
ncbi:MAG: DUF4168 domain-containing protein [Bacteroidales bacterium]